MTTAIQPGTKSTWKIDPTHSTVEFAVKHMMISTVRGSFPDITGQIVLDEGNLADSSVDVTINVASITTGAEQRDTHLKSPDFFDVATYPNARFVSKRVIDKGDGEVQLVGDLTIRDVTREVTLSVSDEGRGRDPWGGDRAGFSAKTKFNRKDFGLAWNQALETGGVLVSEEVKLAIDLQLTKSE